MGNYVSLYRINENIFKEKGFNRSRYYKHDVIRSDNAYEEIMALSSTSFTNFYSRTMHRTHGYSLYPYWNQGVMMADLDMDNSYDHVFDDIGQCRDESFYRNMKLEQFIKIMNFSNTAWPNELANKISSPLSAVCQYASAEVSYFYIIIVIVFSILTRTRNTNQNKYKD